jgi:hypothetical protein
LRTDPIKTIIPVRILKKAIKLITQETLSNISSMILKTCLKSIIETLGKFVTKSRCNAADLSSLGALAVNTLNCGASSNTPFGKTMEKLSCARPQSTFRILPTVVCIRSPCILKTIVSPTVTLASAARLSEIEI